MKFKTPLSIFFVLCLLKILGCESREAKLARLDTELKEEQTREGRVKIITQLTSIEAHASSRTLLWALENRNYQEVHKETIPHEAAFGEFLGIVRFSKKGAGFIKSEIERIMQIEGNLDKYFSFSINRLINKGVEVHYCDISYPWIEIDFPEEMELAEKILPNMKLASQ